MNHVHKRHLHIRALCEGAIMVAIAQVLGYIKIYQMPSGGSVTLNMLPLLLYALRWGMGKGLACGFAFGLLQLLFDGAYAWGWQSMVLDYLAAYTPLGLAGLFRGKAWGFFPGSLLGCVGRFAVHFISGVTIYRITMPTDLPGFGTISSPVAYSLAYNSVYVFPSMVLVLAVAGILYVPLRKYLAGEDLKAASNKG